jgi:hypothetical protein
MTDSHEASASRVRNTWLILPGPSRVRKYPRRVDLAVERPATGEQSNTGVQPARPHTGEWSVTAVRSAPRVGRINRTRVGV